MWRSQTGGCGCFHVPVLVCILRRLALFAEQAGCDQDQGAIETWFGCREHCTNSSSLTHHDAGTRPAPWLATGRPPAGKAGGLAKPLSPGVRGSVRIFLRGGTKSNHGGDVAARGAADPDPRKEPRALSGVGTARMGDNAGGAEASPKTATRP